MGKDNCRFAQNRLSCFLIKTALGDSVYDYQLLIASELYQAGTSKQL